MKTRRGMGSGRSTRGRHSRFSPGEKVRVADRAVLGHCRTPWYLRGKSGVVASVHGIFRDPESLAYHKPGLPAQVLYKVRFRQRDIWADYKGPTGDQLEADIFEHWLEKEGEWGAGKMPKSDRHSPFPLPHSPFAAGRAGEHAR